MRLLLVDAVGGLRLHRRSIGLCFARFSQGYVYLGEQLSCLVGFSFFHGLVHEPKKLAETLQCPSSLLFETAFHHIVKTEPSAPNTTMIEAAPPARPTLVVGRRVGVDPSVLGAVRDGTCTRFVRHRLRSGGADVVNYREQSQEIERLRKQ